MSFGKDPNNLTHLAGYGAPTSLGQQLSAASPRKGTSAGRSQPYWKGGFEISENPAAPSTFRLIAGDYEVSGVDDTGENQVTRRLPFWPWREHFHAVHKRGAICSAGPEFKDKHRRAPCVGCAIDHEDFLARMDKQARGDSSKGPHRISWSPKTTFNIFDYATYYKLPDVDDNGQARINPKTNEPYTQWRKPQNPNDPWVQQFPWKFGDVRPWTIGAEWREILRNQNEELIGLSCGACGTRNSITSQGHYCGFCNVMLLDPNNTTMSKEAQNDIKNKPVQCRSCGSTGYSNERVWCSACGDKGRRATIYEVDLVGYRMRVGDKKHALIITGFHGPGPVQVTDPEVLKTIKPLPLNKRFAPTPVDVQAQLFKVSTQELLSQPTTASQPHRSPYAPTPAFAPAQGPQYMTQPQPVNVSNMSDALAALNELARNK